MNMKNSRRSTQRRPIWMLPCSGKNKATRSIIEVFTSALKNGGLISRVVGRWKHAPEHCRTLTRSTLISKADLSLLGFLWKFVRAHLHFRRSIGQRQRTSVHQPGRFERLPQWCYSCHHHPHQGLSTVFSTAAAHKLVDGAVVQEVAALHVRLFSGISVSTQMAALRELRISAVHQSHGATRPRSMTLKTRKIPSGETSARCRCRQRRYQCEVTGTQGGRGCEGSSPGERDW
ncbi:hypothetical protein B0H14DRAFT_1149959 [Mycena olivaceomarginata]|nr:hypothetical protein B0H14DRAFT_1149959 [Mycena olivaceomarginata]